MTLDSPESPKVPNTSLSLPHLVRTAITLGCVSCCAVLLNSSSWGSGSISILWPTTGLLIGILICLPRKHWPVYLAVAAAVDVLVNTFVPTPRTLAGMVYLAGCNSIEVLLGAWLLQPVFSSQRTLTRPGQLIRFMFYGVVVAPAIASLFAGRYLSTPHGDPNLNPFLQWFTADALGISIVTPLYLGFLKRPPFSNRKWLEVALLLALLCAVSILVFWQTTLPLLFLILPFLLVVEVRLGLTGSAIGLLAVSVIGGYSTAHNRGPISLTNFASLSSRTLIVQFFTFVCIIVLYIMEVILAEQHRLEVDLSASELRFRLIAEGTHDMIMLQNLERERQYVSPAVTALLGWERQEFLDLNHEELIHPDDLAAVNGLYEHCLAGRAFNSIDYRSKTKDGGYLWLEGNLVLHRAPETGVPVGFIKVSHDISSRKAAEDELNRALGVAESRASIDALTGVANRRSFDEFLEGEWLRAIRSHTAISLLMIDVDHFKLFNDRYGHISGDNCLKEIARTIASCIHRPTDLLARYGGEEFIVVLPNTDAGGARSIAEQIRCSLEQRQIPHEESPQSVVTVSIGCATQSPERRSLSTLLVKIADEALYQAKSAGRNAVA